jgi:hypothetical protein
LNSRFIKSSIIKSKKNEPIIIQEDKVMDFFYLKDLIPILEYGLFYDFPHKDINLSYKNKYKLSEIAEKIVNQNNSKSEIIIQNKNGLNYNGDFNKLLKLPIQFQGFETGIKKTIINVK